MVTPDSTVQYMIQTHMTITDQMDTAANQYYMSTVCCYWLYLARLETTQLVWTGLHTEIHCSAQQKHTMTYTSPSLCTIHYTNTEIRPLKVSQLFNTEYATSTVMKVKTWLPDSRVSYNSMVDHRS